MAYLIDSSAKRAARTKDMVLEMTTLTRPGEEDCTRGRIHRSVKPGWLMLFAVLLVSLSATPSRADWSVSAGTGISLCQPSGSADCNDVLPGPFFNGAVEYRFWRLGIGFDYDYGIQFATGTGAENVSVSATHAMPMLKYYHAFVGYTGFLGLGLGYSSHEVTETSNSAVVSEARWFSYWSGIKATLGALLPAEQVFGPNFDIDGLELDLRLETVFNTGGQRCVTWENAGSCQPISDAEGVEKDVAGSLALGAAFRYTF